MTVARWLPLVATLVAMLAAPAQAEPRRHGPHSPPPAQRQPPPRHVPAPPPHRAVPMDWDHGRWHHGWHGDRIGWWWVVGWHWYFIDPWYPYWQPWPPREVIVIDRDRDAVEPEPAGSPPPAYWYRCDDPSGYYPYVNECPGGWTAVPALPPASGNRK